MAKKLARKGKKKLSKKYASFSGRMVMIGFGSIGQGVLPLIFRHIDIKPEQITIISAEDRGGLKELKKFGITFIRKRLTRENLRQTLDKRLGKGDFLVNLSVEVASTALVELCQEKGAFYIDTCIEPWPGGYTDASLSVSLRSNYALRENMLKLVPKYRGGPTAVIAHGANPGLVSHFVKKALVNLAKDTGLGAVKPTTREGWGAHEKGLPPDGARHEFGCDAAIYLNRPGLITRVRTWTPIEGPFHGFIITHNESISIADYFSLRQGQHVVYRPTVHYAYHPCDQAIMSMHECAGKNLHQQKKQRLIVDEITDGRDELGVLLMGHQKGAYWYGSQLDIHETRELTPYNNATSIQVCAPVLSGIIWALENPERGIVEADEMDFDRNLEICMPYLGPVVGKYSDWTPLKGRDG